MKLLLKTLTALLLFLGILVLLLYAFNYQYILKGIKVTYFSGHTTAHIEDFTEFDNRKIEKAEAPEPWAKHSQYNRIPPSENLRDLNKKYGTIAFLIIKNDSIWFENYAETFGPDSQTNSFSMAKSIVAALLGKAIKDGYIESMEQPVSDFLPQFNEDLKIGDLASMASGLNWEEEYYSPFSMTARAYFDENLRDQILALKITGIPGKEFEYLSGNTQLLAMVIEKATGQTLSDYLSESFWKPMGMENDALWQLDSQDSGMEKAYCCIASNARDFAKMGKLYKNFGKWNGKQILDSSFVARSIRPRFDDYPHYGYGFWLEKFNGKDLFYLRGIHGQYTIVIPEDDLIIVRLGHSTSGREEGKEHPEDLYQYLQEVYLMMAQETKGHIGTLP